MCILLLHSFSSDMFIFIPLVIRGIALGTLNDKTQRQFLNREFKMAISLSLVLSIAGFIRAILFKTPIPETIAITSALALIVFTSVCFGAVLQLRSFFNTLHVYAKLF